MCVVSFIGDHYTGKWKDYYIIQPNSTTITFPQIYQEEFDKLKKEVEDMKELLKKAKIYDEKNNEPNCEMDDKVRVLKEIAKVFGVDLSEVFK